ncbi:cell division protein FtsB [Deinococcus petrolearius]|uniref:Cell division protein FtsB n=1 Tax=Deinococcus petrolearius TaxID=1751295 RepID=A0ABW1DNN4_9DEIO
MEDHRAPPSSPLSVGRPVAVRGSLRGRWRQWQRLPVTLIVASLLLGLGIVQLAFQLGNTAYRSVTWTRETRETRVRVAALERDVMVLQEAERSASDPAYLQELARCQGFVGQSETVVVAQKGAPRTPGENCELVRLP